MRFIHLADVHLGAQPDLGYPWSRKREEQIWESFRRVIAEAAEEKTDLLIIAGDLFHRQPLMRELKEVNYLFSTIPDLGLRMQLSPERNPGESVQGYQAERERRISYPDRSWGRCLAQPSGCPEASDGWIRLCGFGAYP